MCMFVCVRQLTSVVCYGVCVCVYQVVHLFVCVWVVFLFVFCVCVCVCLGDLRVCVRCVCDCCMSWYGCRVGCGWIVVMLVCVRQSLCNRGGGVCIVLCVCMFCFCVCGCFICVHDGMCSVCECVV